VSRVNDEVPRLSKLHEDARRCSKDFQQVWYELEMFMCAATNPCEVKKNIQVFCFTWFNGKIIKSYTTFKNSTVVKTPLVLPVSPPSPKEVKCTTRMPLCFLATSKKNHTGDDGKNVTFLLLTAIRTKT